MAVCHLESGKQNVKDVQLELLQRLSLGVDFDIDRKIVAMEGRTRVIPEDFIMEEIRLDRICDIWYSSLNRLGDRLFVRFRKKRRSISTLLSLSGIWIL